MLSASLTSSTRVDELRVAEESLGRGVAFWPNQMAYRPEACGTPGGKEAVHFGPAVETHAKAVGFQNAVDFREDLGALSNLGEGRPVRDENSTSYVAAIETAEAFGLRLYTEAWRRGWSRAQRRVVIGDGAIWIWNLADQHFPGAIQIVDLYHARQHLWDLSAKLFSNDNKGRKRWIVRCLDRLNRGKIEALVKILRDSQPGADELAKTIANEADYFERNAERMRYPSFRAQGLFVGSGVVEAGCKTVIGARLKCSGMFWTVRGANAIIALRCCRLSRRFEDYWAGSRKSGVILHFYVAHPMSVGIQ